MISISIYLLNAVGLTPGGSSTVHIYTQTIHKARQSSPITDLEWSRGFQEVKIPRFHDKGTGWCQGCQPYAPATFNPRKYTWYSFLLEAGSTPRP